MPVNDRQPTNINYLSPLGFRFSVKRLPNISYFCQAATLPGMSINQIDTNNPFIKIPRPGEKVQFEPLQIRFKVDENMENYNEIINWMFGIGFPENFEQYKQIAQKHVDKPARTKGFKTIYSDCTLTIMTNAHNPNIQVFFRDMFPISLVPLNFDATASDIQHLEADCSFAFRDFVITTI